MKAEITSKRPVHDTGGSDQGMRVLSSLIAGIAFYGGLGWLGDQLLDTRWLLPLGLLLGAATSVYIIIKRYGGGT